MREIKFRAWNKNTNKMYKVGQITIEKGIWDYDPDNREYIGVSIPYQPSFILMQYTGLKDKNGKEIYEGDIVQAVVIKQNRNTEDEVEEKIMPVVFEKAEFLLKDNSTAFGPTFHHLRLCKSIKVIRKRI